MIIFMASQSVNVFLFSGDVVGFGPLRKTVKSPFRMIIPCHGPSRIHTYKEFTTEQTPVISVMSKL